MPIPQRAQIIGAVAQGRVSHYAIEHPSLGAYLSIGGLYVSLNLGYDHILTRPRAVHMTPC